VEYYNLNPVVKAGKLESLMLPSCEGFVSLLFIFGGFEENIEWGLYCR
jgi:hypothetical protein